MYSLAKISSHIGATLQGDPNCMITGIASLQQAQAGQLSFLDNPAYRKYLPATQASAVILSSADSSHCSTNALVMNNPYLGYAQAAGLFEKKPQAISGIHPTAVIADNCRIDSTASIGALCVLGKNSIVEKDVVINSGCIIGENTHIGSNSLLWANVTIYYGTHIGQRVIIHSGAIIGSDGFGFANDKGLWHKIPQLGNVQIGNDVEIGANTTIDRGALNDTIIEEGVKLDNLIQIGHNAHIGAHTVVAGCVAIAGSATIGKHCVIGGGAGIAGHIEIVERVIITGMSRVSHSITQPGIYSSGSPIQKNQEWRKNAVRMKQLDEITRRLQKLEKVVK